MLVPGLISFGIKHHQTSSAHRHNIVKLAGRGSQARIEDRRNDKQPRIYQRYSTVRKAPAPCSPSQLQRHSIRFMLYASNVSSSY